MRQAGTVTRAALQACRPRLKSGVVTCYSLRPLSTRLAGSFERIHRSAPMHRALPAPPPPQQGLPVRLHLLGLLGLLQSTIRRAARVTGAVEARRARCVALCATWRRCEVPLSGMQLQCRHDTRRGPHLAHRGGRGPHPGVRGAHPHQVTRRATIIVLQRRVAVAVREQPLQRVARALAPAGKHRGPQGLGCDV